MLKVHLCGGAFLNCEHITFTRINLLSKSPHSILKAIKLCVALHTAGQPTLVVIQQALPISQEETKTHNFMSKTKIVCPKFTMVCSAVHSGLHVVS